MNNLIESTKNLRKDFTATGYIVNPERTKMLVIFHNKLQKWLPAGGHVEPNELPHEAALREVFEETGITAKIITDDPIINLENKVDCQIPRPYTILYQIVPENKKDIEHIHVDFIYAMQAEETIVKIDLNEVSNIKWLTKEELLKCNCFDSVKGFAKNFLK
ncbi:MAG: NUDIX hydrolase [candidate division TM6 bacterium GW2011_GWF2_28_16]|nr:MAG: NUDIX hydrolase [candidate division TM6 bacterium GW2011_GWF2_28_16]